MLRRLRRPLLIGSLAFLILVGLLAYAIDGSTAGPLPPSPPDGEVWPGTGAWTTRVLDTLSLDEKVSQLFAAYAYGRFASADDPAYKRLIDRVERFGVGGVILFQSDPMAQATLLNDLQQRAELPLLVSQDMEWGAGMRVNGATTFPRPMALGATRSPAFARSVGYVTAREARALGTHHVYAPVADVNNNPNNPIINVRSFGEDPQLVSKMVTAAVNGLQSGGTLATVKHFPGHGDTNTDSHTDLPLLPFKRKRLEKIELVPFYAALNAGVMSVMTGHLALPKLDSTRAPATLSKDVLGAILRKDMGFRGLVVTDALNMKGVTENYSPGEAAILAIEAGADIILMSKDPYAARKAVLQAIQNGRLTEARINESVERILRAKEWLGLPGSRTVALESLRTRVAARPHRVLAAAIARRSLTLLRNKNDLLPLLDYTRGGAQVAGEAQRRRLLSVTITDEANPEADEYFVGQLRKHIPASLLQTQVLDRRSQPSDYRAARAAAASADVIVVPAFLNVEAWSGHIKLSDKHRRLLQGLIDTGKPVILIALGNPYLAQGLSQQPGAYIAAYGASKASQKAAVEALLGKSGFSGKLPVTIPGTYAFGDGLQQPQVALRHGPPEGVGMNGRQLINGIDSLMHASIEEEAFPGAAVAIGRGKATALLDAYGYYTYDSEKPVTPGSRFDLASLTKAVATTTAAMQLYEADRLNLNARVASYLPAFAQKGKENVTVRQLLSHSAGLRPFRPFAQEGVRTRQAVIDSIMAEPLQYPPGTTSQYSDLGMVTMGLVIEKITGRSLAEYTEEEIFDPLGMDDTGYRPLDHFGPDDTIVPTEHDTAFRQRVLQGEVHDETAYLMNGVSGNAGLFSTAEDLAIFGYMLVNEGRIYGHQFLEEETIERFTERVEGLGSGNTRALGWDTKSMEGYSSAGDYFGPNSFGHTGFTGTSFWVDPDEDLFAILLTNRVYPTRNNRKIIEVRPKLANIAHRSIVAPPRPLLPGRNGHQVTAAQR